VLAGYLKKIGAQTLAENAGKFINIHPGPLPATAGKYGVWVHKRVLELGLEQTEINIHYVDGEYDTGRTIVKYPVRVPVTAKWLMDKETATNQLQQAVLAEEHRLLPKVVDWLLSGNVFIDENGVTVKVDDEVVVQDGVLLGKL